MKFVIFGAGGTGLQAYAKFCDEYDIVCFCDNNVKKQGQKYCKLPVIAPEEIIERGLKVIIPSSVTHFEKAQQLFNMGIKEFYLVNPDNKHLIAHIDLTPYDDLSPKSNRVWVRGYGNHGASSSIRALVDYNPFNDIDIVASDNYNVYGDGASYYAHQTSSIVITQCAEEVFDKLRIELFHGFPIKAIQFGSYDNYAQELGNMYSKRLNNEKTIIASYSRLYDIFFGHCMRIPQEKFHITGMPRNDLLLRSDAETKMRNLLGNISQKNIIFYAPTFRESKGYGYEGIKYGYIFSWLDFNADDFDMFLKKHNILLLTKLHSAELVETKIMESEHIRLLTDDDFHSKDIYLYEILGATDMLITDYSSISVDYLLLDKPIVYAIRDVDEYSQKHGLMTEPFDAWAPGETVQDYESLKSAILSALSNEDKYKEKREQMRRIMHKYHDGESSRRVLDLARSIINTEKI